MQAGGGKVTSCKTSSFYGKNIWSIPQRLIISWVMQRSLARSDIQISARFFTIIINTWTLLRLRLIILKDSIVAEISGSVLHGDRVEYSISEAV